MQRILLQPRRRLLQWILLIALAVLYGDVCSADPTDFAGQLRAQGLINVRDVWINRHEQSIKEGLASLAKLEPELLEAQKRIDKLVEQNETVRLQIASAEGNLQKMTALAEATQSGTPLRKTRDDAVKAQQDLLQKLKPRYFEPLRFAELPAATDAVLQLNGVRDNIFISIGRLRKQIRTLKRSYRPLNDDPDIAAAIKAISPTGTLGPAETYESELDRLAKVEATLASQPIPVYRESGQFRITAIINDHFPATLTFKESPEPTIITLNFAEAAGIDVSTQAPASNFPTADGRALPLRSGKIPKLRIGPFVATALDASVLPAEGEDLGSQISTAALAGFTVQIQPQLLRLELKPAPSPQPAADISAPATPAAP